MSNKVNAVNHTRKIMCARLYRTQSIPSCISLIQISEPDNNVLRSNTLVIQTQDKRDAYSFLILKHNKSHEQCFSNTLPSPPPFSSAFMPIFHTLPHCSISTHHTLPLSYTPTPEAQFIITMVVFHSDTLHSYDDSSSSY